jgi:hypothetical protein
MVPESEMSRQAQSQKDSDCKERHQEDGREQFHLRQRYQVQRLSEDTTEVGKLQRQARVWQGNFTPAIGSECQPSFFFVPETVQVLSNER